MNRKDISKENLYEAVKTLVEMEDNHIHLNQHKLFTLFSIGFQYLLFRSTKIPGAYILRIEDSALAEKLARKAKDPSSRRFLQSLMLPRKLKYGKSTFFLDFFHIGSWTLTSDIPRDKIKGALVIKNTSAKPMTELMEDEEADDGPNLMANLPDDYYISSLTEFVPKTITIAFDCKFDGSKEVYFDFIKKDRERIAGVTISKDIDLDSIDN